jgi:hypothetical protein
VSKEWGNKKRGGNRGKGQKERGKGKWGKHNEKKKRGGEKSVLTRISEHRTKPQQSATDAITIRNKFIGVKVEFGQFF